MMQVQIELPKQLLIDIENIKNELINIKKNFQPKEPTEYLSRQETADLLKVDLSTLWNYQRKKLLVPVSIKGTNRVLYTRKSIQNALVTLNK
ncbi:DNA-binding protein [Tenacibaculum dicentrarchi]|nr:DNA-binding protein [Tenacibaculum dicentrarchi]MDB0614821.1 DNA-binding protein [Tenacibaculum dicentrarchi]MDB0614849.1 DNA-binding protein [Tenacibaculum dicentrarchi]